MLMKLLSMMTVIALPVAAQAQGGGGQRQSSANAVWAAAWSGVPADLKNVHTMAWLRDGGKFFNADDASGLPPLDDVVRDLKALPRGRRVVFLWHYGNGLYTHPADTFNVPADGSGRGAKGPWATNAADTMKDQWTQILRTIRSRGATIDSVVIDNEEMGKFSSWAISGKTLKQIMQDERSAQAFMGTDPVRPHLSRLGDGSAGFGQNYDARTAWDSYNNKIAASLLNEAIYEPLKARFPRAKCSNYGGMVMSPAEAVPELNGHVLPLSSTVGTHSAPVLYGALGQVCDVWAIDGNDPTRLRYGFGPRIDRSAWGSMLMDVQTARAVRRSTREPMQPWIAPAEWDGDTPGRIGYPTDPRYHAEMVRHVAMLDVDNFLYFNPAPAFGKGSAKEVEQRQARAARDLDVLFDEINKSIEGCTDSVLIKDRLKWNTKVVVSALPQRSGGMLLRITVAPGVSSVTLGGGQVVDFPAGTVGKWVNWAGRTVPEVRANENSNPPENE